MQILEYPFTIHPVHGPGLDGFCVIRPHAVIQHNIGQNLNVAFLESGNGRQVLFPRTIFCWDSAFLTKFSQVIQIIDPIPRILASALALERRRQPDTGDSQSFQKPRLGRDLAPQSAVRTQIPFKVLNQCLVPCHVCFLLPDGFRTSSSIRRSLLNPGGLIPFMFLANGIM